VAGLSSHSEEWAEAEFCYLTTTGRRTGKPHTIEIWFALHEGRVFMLAGGRDKSDWIRNLRIEPQVSVRVGDQTVEGQARVLEEGTPDDALARRLLVEKYEPIERDSLAQWGRTALPVVIDFS
jgi:deazaflavin-dependent oxidoreductase (nitroreductase family)